MFDSTPAMIALVCFVVNLVFILTVIVNDYVRGLREGRL